MVEVLVVLVGGGVEGSSDSCNGGGGGCGGFEGSSDICDGGGGSGLASVEDLSGGRYIPVMNGRKVGRNVGRRWWQIYPGDEWLEGGKVHGKKVVADISR